MNQPTEEQDGIIKQFNDSVNSLNIRAEVCCAISGRFESPYIAYWFRVEGVLSRDDAYLIYNNRSDTSNAMWRISPLFFKGWYFEAQTESFDVFKTILDFITEKIISNDTGTTNTPSR